MLHCLIVDDEPLARQVLESYITRLPGLKLVGACANAVEAYRILHEHKTDLLFLDIKMPLIDGLTFIKSLKQPPSVIFTTAFAEHAAESYDLSAVDYLLKPFSYERFCRGIEKMQKIDVPEEQPIEKNYMFIKANNALVKIIFHEIEYLEARKDYLKVVTLHGSYLTYMTMKYIASLLPQQFIRVHRSYIISLPVVTRIDKSFVTINKTQIPIGNYYKNYVDKAFRGI